MFYDHNYLCFDKQLISVFLLLAEFIEPFYILEHNSSYKQDWENFSVPDWQQKLKNFDKFDPISPSLT